MIWERIIQWGFIGAIGFLFVWGISGCESGLRLRKSEPRFPEPASLNLEYLNKVDTVIEEAIKNHVTPGAVLIIGTPEKTYISRAYGRLSYDGESTSMTLETIFDLASVSKIVGTATATMLLVQDGKIALDDPVSKYISEFAQAGKDKVTIYHLLTHTSGLPAYAKVKDVKAAADPNIPAHENLIRYISHLPPKYETGKDYIYSCLNFLVLAYINQKIIGYNQDKFLKERVYEPLGMKDTTYYLTEEEKKRTAPTIKSAEEFRQGEVHDPLAFYSVSPEYAPGNAGLFSTALDLEKYARMILNYGYAEGRAIFRQGVVQIMTMTETPPEVKEKRGLGWDVFEKFPWATRLNTDPGTEVAGHTGYTGTLLRIDKYARNYLILLTNRVYPDDKAEVKPLREAIMKILIESCPLYKGRIPEL